jgi:WhiB family redox-sensing transcriptional regulator
MTIFDLSEATAKPQSIPPARDVSASREVRFRLLTGMMESTSPMPDLSDLIARPSWQKDAACRGYGTERFILPTGSREVREAKRICSRCPVTEQCLTFALRDPGIKGIWAGTSARERDRMRAVARKAKVDLLASSSEASTAAS